MSDPEVTTSLVVQDGLIYQENRREGGVVMRSIRGYDRVDLHPDGSVTFYVPQSRAASLEEWMESSDV